MVAELELILVSCNRVYATLDSTSTIFAHSEADPIRPVGTIPHRISARQTETGVWGRMGSPAQNRSPRPLLDTLASTIKK